MQIEELFAVTALCVWEHMLAIVWDFLLYSLLIYDTYCELDVNVGENSIPQTKNMSFLPRD